jgi:hypothetical protein
MSKREAAITQMETWAADDSNHGYDQTYRWGERGDYDCSGAVISAWELAGVPVKTNGATYTGNMREVFLRCGFTDVTDTVDLSTGSGLVRSDVLLNHQHHTAMYCGNGYEVEASINELGSTTGGTPGDQTGREFLVRSYRNYPWNCVLRYTGDKESTETETTTPIYTSPTYEYSIKLGLLKQGMQDYQVLVVQTLLTALGYYTSSCDFIFGELTKRAVLSFQADNGLETDGEVGAQTWTALLKG